MPDIIHTQILDTFSAVVSAVTGIQKVLLNPPTPLDRKDVLLPAVFLFATPLTTKQRNRLEEGQFNVQCEVWAEGADYQRTVQNYAGEVRKAIYTSVRAGGTLHAFHVACSEVAAEKQFVTLDVAADGSTVLGMGVAVLRYSISFLTNARDPFTQSGY